MWGFSHSKKTFEHWLRDLGKDLGSNQHVRTQASDLMFDGHVMPQLMLYLEWFEEDWAALCALMGWPLLHGSTGWTNALPEDQRHNPGVTGPADRAMQHLFSHYAADFALYELLRPRRVGNLMRGE